MIAMWQALNPEAWFDDPSEIHTDELGTFAIGPKQRLTPETPLAPFHRTETADESDSKLRHYLNSNDVRHWTELGYSYPELQPWLPKWGPDGALSKAYADYIRSRIIDLYTPIAEAADFEKLKIPSSAKQSLMASIASFAAQAAPAQEDESFDILDYVVNISYEKSVHHSNISPSIANGRFSPTDSPAKDVLSSSRSPSVISLWDKSSTLVAPLQRQEEKTDVRTATLRRASAPWRRGKFPSLLLYSKSTPIRCRLYNLMTSPLS